MNMRRVMQALAMAAVVIMTAFFVMSVGCSKEESKPGTPISDMGNMMTNKCMNSMCPMDMMKIDPASVSDDAVRTYDGMKVGFCSAACAKKFDGMTDAAKKTMMDKTMPK